jgi:serine protease Do
VKGALVGDVTPASPAARGGLEKGDIILGVNGQPVADANQLRLKIGMMSPKETAKLSVLRNGKSLDVSVQLGDFPEKQERASAGSEPRDSVLEGVTVENLTPDTAQQLKLPATTKGVVVGEVSQSSRAAEAGLQQGDVIQEVNHQAVKSVSDFRQAVNAHKDGPVLLLVNRGGNTLFLAV